MKRNIILSAAAGLALHSIASAAILTGTVKTEAGQPVMGAMFTVWNEAQDRKETVYTDASGNYAIKTDFGGKLQVRARVSNWEDALSDVEAGVNERKTVDLTVKHFADPEALTAALAASGHAARLKFPSGHDKTAYISQCNYCHQFGNELTRVPRSRDEWRAAVTRMQGYFAAVSKKEGDMLADVFAKSFDGKPFKAVQNYGSNPELARAKVSQWLVGDGESFLHDMDVGADGHYYGTDEGHDILWDLDPKTHKIVEHKFPSSGLKRAGRFAGMSLPIGIFSGNHGPHSMAETSDHKLWVTNSLSSTVMSFDLKSKGMTFYQLPSNALYPHTIRTAKDDTLWFTINVSNQLGHLDPKTGEITVKSLPHKGFWRWVTDMLLPTVMKVASWLPEKNLPLTISHHMFFGHPVVASAYGIDHNPVDGSVWVAQLYDNQLVRIDPKTWDMKVIPTPYKGPRRPRFDKAGILWIPAFDDGVLMRFDPKTEKFENFKLPVLASNEYEIPYALNIHPQTQEVWITANMTDRVLRFNPKTRTFMSYPSPTRVSVFRDFAFTKDGQACQTTSNLPAYGMEDGVDAYTCFDPTGGDEDKAAIAALK